jgi:hypothetical protein
MITKFKIFENMNDGEPKRFDYVIVNPQNPRMSEYPELLKFLTETIGKIISRMWTDSYCIIYENIPDEIMYYFEHLISVCDSDSYYYKYFEREEIEFWSEDKEELEKVLDAKKYNL